MPSAAQEYPERTSLCTPGPHILQEGLRQDEPHPHVCLPLPVCSPKSPLPPIPILASYLCDSVLVNKLRIPKGWGVWTRVPPDDSPRTRSSPSLLQLRFVPAGLVQPQDSQCPLAEDSQAQPLRRRALLGRLLCILLSSQSS